MIKVHIICYFRSYVSTCIASFMLASFYFNYNMHFFYAVSNLGAKLNHYSTFVVPSIILKKKKKSLKNDLYASQSIPLHAPREKMPEVQSNIFSLYGRCTYDVPEEQRNKNIL